MRKALIVWCNSCGSVVTYASVGAVAAGVAESALTTVVRAIVGTSTARGARLIEGVCSGCALSREEAGKLLAEKPAGGRSSAEGHTPPGSEPHSTQLDMYPTDQESSNASSKDS